MLITLGCGRESSPAAPPTVAELQPQATTLSEAAPLAVSQQLVNPTTGMAEGVLGIYSLERDPEDPTVASLSMQRLAQASQGDIYALSVRPYMTVDNLQLLSSAPAAGDMTDYTLRFIHPFGLPADFNPPATASKRLDLFIFDVNLVVAIQGDRSFFGGNIRTNVSQVDAMSGYRMIGPMLDLSKFGIADGTNVFPYRLIHRIDGANPAGNYGTDGWIQNEFLNATGYDVIAQGNSADGTLRLANSLGASIPIVVIAKYMDPRAGGDGPTKRANRLPNADPANLRYFLPEAAGDLQNMRVTVQGSLRDNSDTEVATLTVNVLDWDNAADITPVFPDHSFLNMISEPSRPTEIEASFPDMNFTGTFPYNGMSQPSGVINEYIDISIPVTNPDKTFIAPPTGTTVTGLIRVRDEQDYGTPQIIVLDEALQVQPVGAGFEPSTRFQKATIPVTTGRVPPQITAVEPASGISGQLISFSAVNSGGPLTGWTWGFGGGATPNTSTLENPEVVLGAPGTYTCILRGSNDWGSQDFYFQLEVEEARPFITDVIMSTDASMRNCTFTAVNSGEAATDWVWDFGGGALPATSTQESPVARLAKPGTYTGTVTASNPGGTSDPFEFEFTPVTKKIGVRLQVITNGSTFPAKLYGMSAWDQAGVNAWVEQWVNGPFRNCGVEVDLDQVEFIPVNNPALFNIDTQAEYNQLWSMALGQNPNKLNAVAINGFPSAPGLGGVMTDTSSGCNPNNNSRGCFVITFNAPFDTVCLPHELGHVMNLPHVRTSGPINENNYNLMSYGTTSNALSANAVREEAASCITFSGAPPVNQFHVVSDWVHTYM